MTQPTTQAIQQAREIAAEAWEDLVEKVDRTSPEEYPDMALITHDKLQDYISHALSVSASEREPLEAENRRYREALEWYASDEAWTIDQVEGGDGDYGNRARAALNGAKRP